MIKIYGRDNCKFCQAAVKLCVKQGVKFQYMNYIPESISDIANDNNHKTVPIIFDKLMFIGGYKELQTLLTVHNTWQKITWWLVTAYHFFHCKQTYRTRINARAECARKVINRD